MVTQGAGAAAAGGGTTAGQAGPAPPRPRGGDGLAPEPPAEREAAWRIAAGTGAAKVVSRGRKESGAGAWSGGSRGGPAGGGEKPGEGAGRSSASLGPPGSGSGKLRVACV
ncbi:unnamed protein product [Coccothraustes coccothraustes]